MVNQDKIKLAAVSIIEAIGEDIYQIYVGK